MTWGMIGSAAVATVGSSLLSKGSGGGGGGGGGGGQTQQYIPTGLGAADSGWMSDFTGQQGIAGGTPGVVNPLYQQTLGQETGWINYDPYLNAAGTAGGMYGQTGQTAMAQMGGYGDAAQQARGQQQNMYDAGAQVFNTAMDPQHQLYDRTAQRVQDQVRSGQAVRGLGNSAQGAGEEDQAMSNFNIDWQNNQLQRQTQGLQANVSANAAGINQGRLYGADQSAALAAGAAGAGYYGQSGQVPLTAQEYARGAPGRAADTYMAAMGGEQQMYGNAQAGAIPYMNFGNGAIQTNYANQYQQNRDNAQMFGQIGSAAGPQVANWFGGGGWSPNTSSGSSDWATGSGGYSQYTQPDYGAFL